MEHTKTIPIYRIIKRFDKSENKITKVIFIRDEINEKLIMANVCEMTKCDSFDDWDDFTSKYKLDIASRIYTFIK